MPFLSETEIHPAEKLAGFTVRVPLLAGTVLIRKVDVQAVTLDAALHIINAKAALKVASKHAEEASNEAAARSDKQSRPKMELEDELQTTIEASRSLMRSALVQPRLEELVAAYGGREDLSEPDFGMGEDYATLMNAINTHCGSSKEAEAQAERFLGAVGSGGGQSGAAVQPKAE